MEIGTDDLNSFVQNYQRTNRLLVNRSILMAVLFILIVGIQNSNLRNDRTRVGLFDASHKLSEVANSTDVKQSLDKASGEMTSAYYSVVTDSEMKRLDFDLSKSGYKDKTPIYDLIANYEKRLGELGLTSRDYQISVLGLNSSFSTWFYFAPIILLLLYHDMTRTILYRAALRRKIKYAPLGNFKIGSEIFGTEGVLGTKPTSRFMHMITNLLVTVLIFLPLIPVFIAAISYISENRESDINPFMVLVQWVSPAIMTVELIIIYYTENLLGMRELVLWFRKLTTKWPSHTSIFIAWLFSLGLTILYGSFTFIYETSPGLRIVLIVAVLISTSILPVSSMLLYKYPEKYVFRGVRLVGRTMILFWIFNFVDFSFVDRETYLKPYYPIDFWLWGALILLGTMACIGNIYTWVFSGKYKRLNKIIVSWKERRTN
jgi:hypothetical protein